MDEGRPTEQGMHNAGGRDKILEASSGRQLESSHWESEDTE